MERITNEEKKILKKIDLHLIPLLIFLYLLSFLDRVNVGNVHAAIKKYNNINEYQFAAIIGIFFVGYILFEVPSNLLLKKAKPSRWIARIMVSWGIISTCMAWAQSFLSILICRVLLGIAEAGFFPGIVYYLTFWYPNEQRALRIASFFCAAAVAGAFGGLIAYGILSQMEGIGRMHAYQWLFIIEGIPSVVFGCVTWFWLPDFPATASFLTHNEKQIWCTFLESSQKSVTSHIVNGEMKTPSGSNMVDRTEGSTHPSKCMGSKKSDIFHFKAIKATISSHLVWFFAVLYFCLLLPLYSSAFFLPALLGELGLSPIRSNLLTVPLYCIATTVTILWSHHSDYQRERSLHLSIASFIGGMGFVGLGIWGSKKDHFALAYISIAVAMLGIYPTISCCLAWVTSTLNVSPDIDRLMSEASDQKEQEFIKSTQMATQTAFVVSFGNLGGIVGPQIFAAAMTSSGNYSRAHYCMAAFLFSATVASAVGSRSRVLNPKVKHAENCVDDDKFTVNLRQDNLPEMV